MSQDLNAPILAYGDTNQTPTPADPTHGGLAAICWYAALVLWATAIPLVIATWRWLL